MANINKVNGIAIASISKINGTILGIANFASKLSSMDFAGVGTEIKYLDKKPKD